MKSTKLNLTIILVSIALLGQIACKKQTSPLRWGIKMADSDIKRNPEAWILDFCKTPKWGYTNGLIGVAYDKLSNETGNSKYIDYIKNSYYDVMIDSLGIIDGYILSDYNIDKVNSGKTLFTLYKNTGDVRYKTVMWYQVLNEGSREGNYLESTCSSMFTYSMTKAVRMGYLGEEYRQIARNSFDSLVKTFVVESSDGTISLSKCCSVAGLGGKPYRDGTFEYYIGEKVRDNDPKGIGPFVLAAVEIDRMTKSK